MSTAIETKVTTTMRASPEALAELFWSMDDSEQAAFFEALHDRVTETYESDQPSAKNAYSLGERQWLYMVGKMSAKARKMYMALSAFAFDFWAQRDVSELPPNLNQHQ